MLLAIVMQLMIPKKFSSSLLLFSVKRQFLNVHIYTRNEKWKNVREKGKGNYVHLCVF